MFCEILPPINNYCQRGFCWKNCKSFTSDKSRLKFDFFGIKFAKQKNAKVVVFTDSDVSPLVEFSDCVLIAQSDMASFMDSLVAPLSIINAIIIEITSRREKEITERFDALEKLWDEYEVYAKR